MSLSPRLPASTRTRDENGFRAPLARWVGSVAALSSVILITGCVDRKGQYRLSWKEQGTATVSGSEQAVISMTFVDYPKCKLEVASNIMKAAVIDLPSPEFTSPVTSRRFACCLPSQVTVKLGVLTHGVRFSPEAERRDCPL